MYMWTGKIQIYVNQGATWITVENKTNETIKGQNPLLWLWELQLGLLEAQEMQATTSEVKGGRRVEVNGSEPWIHFTHSIIC